MTYKVVLYPSEEGYAVFCPALRGCASQGETRDEAIENIKDAMRLWLEVAKEDGLKLEDGAELQEIEL